ncbi:hypothetical protein ACKWTF_003162 [Chironomus riparius]
MSFTSFGCRFCLKTIQPNEKMALIDEEVKSQFISLTQIKLDFMEGLSKVVCEVCLRSVQLATALKLQFVENQKKLYSEIEDIQIETQKSEINPNIHDIQESESDLPKSVPQFINTTIHKAVPVKITQKPQAKKRKITPKKVVSENTSNSSFEIQSSIEIEPEIKIKEEQFEEGEIQFHNQFFDQFNYSDTNPFDTNDSDDPSNMLEEMEMKTEQNTSDSARKKVLVKSTVAGERVFPCVYCGKHYNKRHMSRHINVEHKKIKFPCVVPDCPSSYSRKEKLRIHIQAKHIDCSEEEYAELLEKVRNLLPIYENVSHVDIDQPKIKFYCVVPGCQTNYTRKRKLKVHVTENHSDLSPEEMEEVKTKLEALEPVYEMFEDPVIKP